MFREDRFVIEIDETDSHRSFQEREPDVTTHTALVGQARTGRSAIEIGRDVIVAQELGLMKDPVPLPKTVLHLGMGSVVAGIVAQDKTSHQVGDTVIVTKTLANNRSGRYPIVPESEMEDEEESPPDVGYMVVEPGNCEVGLRAKNQLMSFVLGNVRHRLAEIAVSEGLDAMRQAAREFGSQVAEIAASIGEPSL